MNLMLCLQLALAGKRLMPFIPAKAVNSKLSSWPAAAAVLKLTAAVNQIAIRSLCLSIQKAVAKITKMTSSSSASACAAANEVLRLSRCLHTQPFVLSTPRQDKSILAECVSGANKRSSTKAP